MQKRLFVYDIGEGPRTLVNPVISEARGEWSYDEGCLSVPGLSFEIIRPKEIHLTGYDLDGNEVSIEADELLARLFQHELDHLDGVLLLEHLDDDQRKAAMKELRRRLDRCTVQDDGQRFVQRAFTCSEREAAPASKRGIVTVDPPTHPKRLAFLGTPEVAVTPLRALVAAGFDVALVVSRADKRRSRAGAPEPSPVKSAAIELGIRVTSRVDDVLECRRRSRGGRRVRPAREATRAGRGAHGEPPLLAAPAVAGCRARRAGDPRRRRPRPACAS